MLAVAGNMVGAILSGNKEEALVAVVQTADNMAAWNLSDNKVVALVVVWVEQELLV